MKECVLCKNPFALTEEQRFLCPVCVDKASKAHDIIIGKYKHYGSFNGDKEYHDAMDLSVEVLDKVAKYNCVEEIK